VIEERESTTVIGKNARIEIDWNRNIVITLERSG
jgi:hypothetical protein